DSQSSNTSEATPAALTSATFLQDTPLGERRQIAANSFNYAVTYPRFRWPAIELYCSGPKCAGLRFADPAQTSWIDYTGYDRRNYIFCDYHCRNCKQFLKV